MVNSDFYKVDLANNYFPCVVLKGEVAWDKCRKNINF